MIFFLAKVFDQEEYARAFMRGDIFANRLSHFKMIEDGERRGDEYEGAIMPQLEGLIITLQPTDSDTGEMLGEITIPGHDLAAPPIIAPEWFDDINVFCMYAGHSGNFQQISSDDLPDLKKQLELSEDYIGLGEHAVFVTNVEEFLRRVKAAAHREGHGICQGVVEYYDPNVGTPPAHSRVASIFTKREQYAYQKEFRIAIDTRTSGTKPITLNIGSISDIALHLRTGDINRGFILSLPE